MKINLTQTLMTMVAMGTCYVAANSANAQNYGQPYSQGYGQNYGVQPSYNGPAPQQTSQAPNYQAPARWNQYRSVQSTTRNAAESLVESLPTPVAAQERMQPKADMQLSTPNQYSSPAHPSHQGQHQGQHSPMQAPSYNQGYAAPQQSNIYGSPHQAMDHGLVNESNDGFGYGSPYQSAMSVPHDQSCSTGACGSAPSFGPASPTRPELYPWFASANVLFLDLEGGRGNRVFRNYDWTTALADPDSSVGFDTEIGRYIGCGKHAIGVRYFGWNPGEVTAIRNIPVGTPGDLKKPNYDDYTYDAGGGPAALDDHIDGDVTAAANVRFRRDLNFNSLEVNLYSFGLLGAQRVAYAGCDNSHLAQKHGGRYGFGGATGPLARACQPRLRVSTSHGFRWFQATDDSEIAYNINGTPDYQNEDLFDNFNVENNLYGYQFGSFLTYCLGNRLNLNVGGKFGLYGNDVEVEHRIGSRTQTAYVNGDVNNRIDRKASDVVLASLGELDLGLGYRLNNAWTFQGGYKLLGVSGVANSSDSYPTLVDTTKLTVDADNSYLIHGAYVGLAFNW